MLPQTPKLGKGSPEVPYECQKSRQEPGLRPPLGLGSIPPAPRWLPDAVYPANAGAPGRGAQPRGGGRARTRVRTGRPAPRRGPLLPHALCAPRAGAGRLSWVPRGQDPGAAAAAAASPGPAPGWAPAVTRAAAGVSVCREGGAKGLGPTKAQEEEVGGGGSRLPRTATLMKCRLGSPRRQGTYLENANAIGKCRANRQNFY